MSYGNDHQIVTNVNDERNPLKSEHNGEHISICDRGAKLTDNCCLKSLLC